MLTRGQYSYIAIPSISEDKSEQILLYFVTDACQSKNNVINTIVLLFLLSSCQPATTHVSSVGKIGPFASNPKGGGENLGSNRTNPILVLTLPTPPRCRSPPLLTSIGDPRLRTPSGETTEGAAATPLTASLDLRSHPLHHVTQSLFGSRRKGTRGRTLVYGQTHAPVVKN